MRSILLLSPTLAATGNTSTVNRLRDHYVRSGFKVVVSSPDLFKKQTNNCNVTALNEFIREKSISCLLLIHAVKSGACVLCSCSTENPCKLIVKYGVIFGGTDLNEDVRDTDKRVIMKTCLDNSAFGVAFTESLHKIAKDYFPNTFLYTQPQALSYELYDACKMNLKHATYSDIPCKPIVFLLSCSIRQVKDPFYLVDSFLRWKKEMPSLAVRLLILGPVLDEDFATKFFIDLKLSLEGFYGYSVVGYNKNFHSFPPLSSLSSDSLQTWLSNPEGSVVQYVSALQQDHFQDCLKKCDFFALVNTSLSEGMASSLLEAMACGLPVFARSIPGNKAVVTDKKNGFLFSTPEEFVSKASDLINDDSMHKNIVANAKFSVAENHDPYQEKKFYMSIAQDHMTGGMCLL